MERRGMRKVNNEKMFFLKKEWGAKDSSLQIESPIIKWNKASN